MEIGAKNDTFEPEKVKEIPVPKLTFPPGLQIFCRCPGLENRRNIRLKLFKNNSNFDSSVYEVSKNDLRIA